MSKERPILFNTEMVQAIRDGRKTVTRRIVKDQDGIHPRWNNVGWVGWDDGHGYRMKPPCEVGDILWVRETWTNIPVSPGGHMRFGGMYYYKADGDIRPVGWRGNWHPSIHMPKEAARIFLRVKDVRVERLQEITEEQAILEGCSTGTVVITCDPMGVEVDPDDQQDWTAVEDFEYIWNSTIKPADKDVYGWKANPWVWVITFERCDKPKGWC